MKEKENSYLKKKREREEKQLKAERERKELSEKKRSSGGRRGKRKKKKRNEYRSASPCGAELQRGAGRGRYMGRAAAGQQRAAMQSAVFVALPQDGGRMERGSRRRAELEEADKGRMMKRTM